MNWQTSSAGDDAQDWRIRNFLCVCLTWGEIKFGGKKATKWIPLAVYLYDLRGVRISLEHVVITNVLSTVQDLHSTDILPHTLAVRKVMSPRKTNLMGSDSASYQAGNPSFQRKPSGQSSNAGRNLTGRLNHERQKKDDTRQWNFTWYGCSLDSSLNTPAFPQDKNKAFFLPP